MPDIDIDPDSARAAAAHELAKPVYPKGSLSDRIAEWMDELLHRLMVGSSSLPGGWLIPAVVALLLLALSIVAVRVARRTMGRRADAALYPAHAQSAADHRRHAERFAAQGDWPAAIRHRVRAIGRQLEEDDVLSPVPGRTATELAHDAGTALPALVDDLSSAAILFNDVAYGDRSASESNYRLVADLDDRVRRAVDAEGTTR